MDSYEPGAGQHYRIDTPERVDLDYDVASLGSRLLAALVDTVLVGVLYFLLLLLGTFALGIVGTMMARALESTGMRLDSTTIGIGVVAFVVLLSFLVFWGYYLFFELVWHGQSPGKRWAGLRVIREGGYPIGFSESAIRNLVRLVDFLPIYYGIGALVMFIDKRSRRLGDLAAGTLVVKERRDVKLESLDAQVPTSAAELPAGDPSQFANSHLLTPADQSLLREYLQRRPSLSREAASRLAAQLATALAARMDYDLADEAPEAFLLRFERHLRIQQEK